MAPMRRQFLLRVSYPFFRYEHMRIPFRYRSIYMGFGCKRLSNPTCSRAATGDELEEWTNRSSQ